MNSLLLRLKDIVTKQLSLLEDRGLLWESGVWVKAKNSSSDPSTKKIDYHNIPEDIINLMQSQIQPIREIYEAYLPNLPRLTRPTIHSSSKGLSPGSQLLPSSARGMTFEGLLTFAKDFEIYPQLANKTELKFLWEDVRAQLPENSSSLVMSLRQVRIWLYP